MPTSNSNEAPAVNCLSALARYAEILSTPELDAGKRGGGRVTPDGSLTLPHAMLSDVARAFLVDMHRSCCCREFSWPHWKSTEHGRRLLTEPDAIAQATGEDLLRIVTTY